MRRPERSRGASTRRLAWLSLGIAGVVLAGGLALSRTQVFRARAIEVSGVSAISRAEVVETAGVDRRSNVVWLDESSVQRRLEDHAWISQATVRVVWPLTIEIDVVEREPVAVVSEGEAPLLIADDGTLLGPARRSGPLPSIEVMAPGRAEGATRSPVGAAKALGAMDPALRSKVRKVSVLLDGTLELWLRSGPKVLFGVPSALGAKADAIADTISWAEREGERILVLSVVSPTTPAATLAP